MQLKIDANGREIKTHGTYEFPLRVSHERLSNYERRTFLWHWHGELEWTYIVEGEICYQINEHTLHLKKGQGLLCNSNVLHMGRSISEQDCHYVSITTHPRLFRGFGGSFLDKDYVKPVVDNTACAYVIFNSGEEAADGSPVQDGAKACVCDCKASSEGSDHEEGSEGSDREEKTEGSDHEEKTEGSDHEEKTEGSDREEKTEESDQGQDVAWQKQVLGRLAQVESIFHEKPENYEFQIYLLMMENWLAVWQHAWGIREKGEENAAESRNMQRLKVIFSYIHEHYAEKITLREVAAQVNICQAECCRLFKKYMKESLFDYLLDYRVERSTAVLLDSSVTEAAEASGFSSPAYYTKVFKERMGCTPKEYQKNLRKQSS